MGLFSTFVLFIYIKIDAVLRKDRISIESPLYNYESAKRKRENCVAAFSLSDSSGMDELSDIPPERDEQLALLEAALCERHGFPPPPPPIKPRPNVLAGAPAACAFTPDKIREFHQRLLRGVGRGK